MFLRRHGPWVIWEFRRFFVPLTMLGVIISALIVISTTNLEWRGWALTTGFPDKTFCEAIGDGTVRQPFNAWSSLFFIPIGLWVLRRSMLDELPSPRLSPVWRHKRYGLIYGGALIVMGLGSWFFHASLTYIGHFVDVMGMYFLGGFLFTYGLSRKLRTSASAFTLGYAAVVIPLVLLQWFQPELSRYAFATLILSALGIEVICHNSLRNKLFVLAMISLGFGFVVWMLDEKKLLCWPQSCLQGHAVWHMLTAISTQFSYLYYRSEAPRVNMKVAYRPGRFKALRDA